MASLGEDMSAAWDAAEVVDAPSEHQDTAPPDGSEQQVTQETTSEAGDRARDENGRFTKAQEHASNAPVIEAAKADEQEPPKEAIRPPASWSATAKADFGNLPPHIQQEVLKREQDWDKGQAQRQQEATRYNRLEEVLAPRREALALKGMDETQAVKALFAAQDLLERDPQMGLQYLARSYGVDLAKLAQLSPPGQLFQQPQPAFEPSQIASLVEQKLAEAREAQEQEALRSQVDAFAKDPAHPYYENVKGLMAGILQSGRAQTLQEAYDQATWADPEVRTLLMKAQQTANAQTDQRAKAKDAQKAAGSVTGAPGAANSAAAKGSRSLREDLSEAFEEAAGRA